MLSTVVDQCLTLAIASVSQQLNRRQQRSLVRARWETPLAAYPRLAFMLEKATADGVLAPKPLRLLH